MKTIEKVAKEIQTAKEKYGYFNSTHEVYGVLFEEVDEFFQIVKEKPASFTEQHGRKTIRMIKELTQIAAIAMRAADELEHNNIKWV